MLQCLTCGVEIAPDPNPKRTRKFCSRKCSSISQRVRMTVTCVSCGKTMERSPWQANRNGNQYCSMACRDPAAHITCDWCGKQKRVSPSGVGEHNFCSRKCCRAWQGANGLVAKSTRVTVTCATCGKLFERQPNQIKRTGNQFCSRACFAENHRYRMTGALNPAWRGGFEPYYGPNWDQQARRARRRDQHRCQRCGIAESELGKTLHVHHIIPLRDFQRDFRRANALANLVSFCPSCHKFLEWHPDQMSAFVASWSATT